MSASRLMMVAGNGTGSSVTTTQTYVDDVFSTYLYTGTGGAQTINNGINLLPTTVINEATYTTPGTYSWTCPVGVTAVSAVCIGGGGGGGAGYWAGGGGGGGGLGYKNNITVIPGQTYTVVVGAGGISYTATQGINGQPGGDSYFISAATVKGGGGGGGAWGAGDANGSFAGGAGGTYTGDLGGVGGSGGTSSGDTAGGGGGAGGYAGAGGAGGSNWSGTGGAAAGATNGGSNGASGAAGSGGGVGIFGMGSNGGSSGAGGSGGTNGSADGTTGGATNTGGAYGGGGGGQSNDSKTTPGCHGGGGAVRIIWAGTTRQFPSTNVTESFDTTNGGGLIWVRDRTAGDHHHLVDTARGVNNDIKTNSINPGEFLANSIYGLTATGFTVGSGYTGFNTLNNKYVSWTFRKTAKFFDVVTYTGNGSAGQTITHNLGIAPGMVIIKRTDTTEDWFVWHRGDGAASITGMPINLSNVAGWNSSGYNITSTTTIPLGNINKKAGDGSNPVALNGTYVAYVFAHNPAADSMIKCGSFTTSAVGGATINLGWEPQWLLIKDYIAGGNWFIFDTMRGMSYALDNTLRANTTEIEMNWPNTYVTPTATGFTITNSFFGTSASLIYVAIHRPNKPPTSGTQVFNSVLVNSSTVVQTINATIAPDLVVKDYRNLVNGAMWFDRLRGLGSTSSPRIMSTAPTAEASSSDVYTGSQTTVTEINIGAGYTSVDWFFKRAPGFFDIVCFTGDGSANRDIPHSLGVLPELSITKSRNATGIGDADSKGWIVRSQLSGDGLYRLHLDGQDTNWGNNSFWPSGAVWFKSSTVLNTGNPSSGQNWVNGLNEQYISYLFATLSGVSKVGSYTGNDNSQTINCGFATGARFLLIKRTNAVGDWYAWDSTRGIVGANDPHLSLNTTAVEVTTDDSIDPDNSGFIVNQVAATNINVASATYIFLAIA